MGADPIGDHPEQTRYILTVPALIDSLRATAPAVADRSCDAMALIERIEAGAAVAHMTTQRGRKVQHSLDCAIYKRRNLVE